MLPPKTRRATLRSGDLRQNSTARTRLRGFSNAAFAPAKPVDVKSFASAEKFRASKMEQRLNAFVQNPVSIASGSPDFATTSPTKMVWSPVSTLSTMRHSMWVGHSAILGGFTKTARIGVNPVA